MRSSWREGAVLSSAVAMCLLTAGCGSDSGVSENSPGADVELQVVNGLGNDPVDHHLQIRVKTPRQNLVKAFLVGPALKPENWQRFKLDIEEGEQIQLFLEGAGGAHTVQASGTCTVDGANALSYARVFMAIIKFFNNQYVECADGLKP